MEKLIKYRKIVQQMLQEYGKHKPAHGDIEVETIFDTDNIFILDRTYQILPDFHLNFFSFLKCDRLKFLTNNRNWFKLPISPPYFQRT
jgi:hypothetical protein